MLHNILIKLLGNVYNVRNVSSVKEAWLLLFDNTIMHRIVVCTNTYMEKIPDNFQREHDSKRTNFIEIKPFIGLFYHCGVHKSSHVNVKDIWATDGTGPEIFHRTLSYKRFQFLMCRLRFDEIV